MKLSEVLVSIAIFLLVSVCFMECFIFMSKSENRIISSLVENRVVLETDKTIRNEIDKLTVPYWKNGKEYIDSCINKLKSNIYKENIEILSVEMVKNSAGRPEGLFVLWSYKKKIFETKRNFTSKVIFYDKG